MDNLNTLQSLVYNLQETGRQECILALNSEGIERWTGIEMAETALKLAKGLVAAGVRRGEYIPILAHNRPEWATAALAVISAGAAVSPLDTQIATENLGQVLRDSEARFIFTTTDYLNRLSQLDPQETLRSILFDVEAEDARGWRVLLSDDDSTRLPVVEPDEHAALFYTSGTTGVPKGVPLTHRNLVFQIKSVYEAQLLIEGDRVLLPLPMYHVYPFTVGMLIPLALGVPIILPQSLTGPQIIRALQEGDVTIIIGVPRVYRAMYAGIQNQLASRGKLFAWLFQRVLNLSIWLRRQWGLELGKSLFRPIRRRVAPNLRLLASGGSALDPDLAWNLEGFGWNVAIGYGLTETSPMLTMNLPGSAAPRLASVGPALPGLEIRIAPPDMEHEEGFIQLNGDASTEGEILARGVSVFSGYRNLPDETAAAFTEDGWFRTGDLGHFDNDGFLYISGRASTLIVLEGGKNIQPEPLEDIYQQHEFIQEIGILYQDNQLAALIVPETEAVNRLRNGDAEQAIREAVSDRVRAVASYQRITDYAITTEPLPRTNLGKIQRHRLVDYYNQAKKGEIQAGAAQTGPIAIADMPEKDQALLEHDPARKVWDWLAGRYADKRLTLDTSPQLDLGIDSLEWLTLTLRVNDLTGLELSDEAIGRVSTIRDLLQEVVAAEEGETAAGALSLENPEEMLTEDQRQWLRPVSPILQALGVVVFYLLKFTARLVFRVKAYGLENLPKDGHYVLTPNHSSYLDAPMLASVLSYDQMRQTHWAGSADIMLANPFMRLVSRIGQVLPIETSGVGTGIRNLALGATALHRHKNLVWFPEGRLSRSDQLLPFREGIGIVLDESPTPVVPVYIKGTRQALPADAKIPKPRPVSVTFGPPCDPRELAEHGRGESEPARIVSALQQRVAALAGEQELSIEKV